MTMPSIKSIKFSKRMWIVLYVAVAALVVLAYEPAKQYMISQDPWAWIIQSNITLNFVLIFFIWGVLTDRISVERGWGTNSKKSWGLFFIGLLALIAMFKFLGGYPTRW